MSQSLGVINNLSYKYGKIKQQINENYSFRQPSSLNDSGNGFITDSRKIGFILKGDHPKTELSNWHLPPKYSEIFEHCNDIFQELTIKYGKLQQEQQKRITPNFDENENKILDNNIHSLSQEITDKLKECERCLKEIKFEQTTSPLEEQIKENMRINLANKLSDYTKILKVNQETYCNKYKELNGGDEQIPPPSSTTANTNMFMETQIERKRNFRLQERNKEIEQLLQSINQLAQIFKDVQMIILEQGTILDRIDYNIEIAVTNVGMAKKELIKADNSMRSSCARNANLSLIITIFVLGLLLIFKFIK